MGAADVVPGVSGGTIAFITGIYDTLLESIRRINPSLNRDMAQGRLQGRFPAYQRHLPHLAIIRHPDQHFHPGSPHHLDAAYPPDPVVVLLLRAHHCIGQPYVQTGGALEALPLYFGSGRRLFCLWNHRPAPAEPGAHLTEYSPRRIDSNLCHDLARDLRQLYPSAAWHVWTNPGGRQVTGHRKTRPVCIRLCHWPAELFPYPVMGAASLP